MDEEAVSVGGKIVDSAYCADFGVSIALFG